MSDAISIHAHTPVELLTWPDEDTVWMILEDVLKGFIFDFFRLWIDRFNPLLWLREQSPTCILKFIFVSDGECLWSTVRVPLEKAHPIDFDVSVRDEGEAVPSI